MPTAEETNEPDSAGESKGRRPHPSPLHYVEREQPLQRDGELSPAVSEPVTTKKTRPRKEMSYKRAVITLVIGDLLCFLVFAALGSNTHGEVTGLGAIPHIIVTALPFAAGWFLVSPFVGAFRRNIVAQPRTMAIRTAVAWLISWPVTLILRGIFVDHGIPPLTFAIVILLFNLLILEVWRWPFALNNSLRKRGV